MTEHEKKSSQKNVKIAKLLNKLFKKYEKSDKAKYLKQDQKQDQINILT